MSSKSAPRSRPVKKRTIKLVDEHIGLDDDEEVILLARKHWVLFRNSLFVGIFIPFVIGSILFFIYLIQPTWPEQIKSYITWVLAGLAGIAFICGMIRFMWHFHMWQHTFYVMTNKKLAIINRYKPWSYEVQQINLNNINDVTLRQEGMEAFMYGYSDVVAVTFSGSTFILEQVGHASAVQRAIMQQLALQDRPANLLRANASEVDQ
jgi:hypothetical protein